MRSSITAVICTCWMSLVVRVMRDAVEKRSVSVLEKWITLPNTWRRRSRPMAAETRAARKPTEMAAAAISRAMSSIPPPVASR